MYPDFKYCKEEVTNILVTNRIFNNELEKYLNKENNNEVIEDNTKIEQDYSEYIGLAIIVVVAIVVIVLIIFKIVKERKKKDL